MSEGVFIRYRRSADAPWETATIRSDDPFEVCDRVRDRLFPDVKTPEFDEKFARLMAARKAAPQAPCTVRSGPEVPGATLPASTPATAQSIEAGPPGKSTESEHRLPAQPAAPAGVRDTSMIAYRALKYSGRLTRQQKLVVELMLGNRQRDYTRQELSDSLQIGINAICGRVNELMREPLQVLEECGRRRCRVTGERANALRLAEAQRKAA